MESLTSAGQPGSQQSSTSLQARLRQIVGHELWAFLDLLTLAGFVVAQPLLDVLGRSPDFLLFRKADPRDIVLLAIAITILPAAALWVLEVLAGLPGHRVRQAGHLALVAGLLAVLGLEVAKKVTPLRGPGLLAVGGLVGLGGGLLYARRPVVRLWIRFLYPAPVVFLLLFLLVSPAAQLLRPAAAPTAALPAGALQRAKSGPIVFLLMDEFPLESLLDGKGRIDQRLYPNFAKLAGASTWYRNATANIGLTEWALPSMMTGRYPAQDRLPIASQYPDNLFTLLGASYHYKMHVFEGVTQLCPPSLCPDAMKAGGSQASTASATGGGLRQVARDSAGVWGQIVSPHDAAKDPAATLNEATVKVASSGSTDQAKRAQVVHGYTRGISFQAFLDSIRPGADPNERALYFVHVLIPHQPWKYLPSGLQYPERTLGEGDFAKGGQWVSEPWPVESIHQRHLMQTAVADRMVGDLVKRLREVGLYDRSLLVVTADHGMAFTPGEAGRATVSNDTVPDVLWVPLFIKRPEQRAAEVNDVNYEHVDLLPTIAGLAGLRVPWAMEGVSLADPSADRRSRTEKFFYPHPGLRRAFNGPANQAIALKGVTDRLLRPNDGYLGWFQFGPHADLVGRKLSDLEIAASGGSARVAGLDDYRHVDPSSGSVPAEVGGQLTRTAPGTPGRPSVVVAINGVVGGVSETFASPAGTPPTWFTTMIPDTLMHKGGNQLRLFLLDTSGGRQRLRPLTLSAA